MLVHRSPLKLWQIQDMLKRSRRITWSEASPPAESKSEACGMRLGEGRNLQKPDSRIRASRVQKQNTFALLIANIATNVTHILGISLMVT